MGPNDCLNYANRSIEMAKDFGDETAKVALLNQAKAWLQVAEELNDNDAFRICVKSLEVSESTAE